MIIKFIFQLNVKDPPKNCTENDITDLTMSSLVTTEHNIVGPTKKGSPPCLQFVADHIFDFAHLFSVAPRTRANHHGTYISAYMSYPSSMDQSRYFRYEEIIITYAHSRFN